MQINSITYYMVDFTIIHRFQGNQAISSLENRNSESVNSKNRHFVFDKDVIHKVVAYVKMP